VLVRTASLVAAMQHGAIGKFVHVHISGDGAMITGQS
jgi:hypothetical protein